jgi:hypothetical protein
MLYMLVEHFKNDDPILVYHRFRERGRLAPDVVEFEVYPIMTSKEAAERIAPLL